MVGTSNPDAGFLDQNFHYESVIAEFLQDDTDPIHWPKSLLFGSNQHRILLYEFKAVRLKPRGYVAGASKHSLYFIWNKEVCNIK